jgi:signal transduction histidine kinase
MNANAIRYILIFLFVAMAVASFTYTQFLIDRIVLRNTASVELWAKAIEYIGTQASVEGSDELDFVFNHIIIQNRNQVPTLLTDSEGNIQNFWNIDSSKVSLELVSTFAAMNDSIRIELPLTSTESIYQYVYYGETDTIRSLRLFPYIQFGILSLILGLATISVRSIRRHEQSRLWVGMAKEAAHQLGTPLSSLLGWIELLKAQSTEQNLPLIGELEEDAARLQRVAERFNKIGSSPERTPQRIGPIISDVADYMRRRIPRFGKEVTLMCEVDESIKCAVNTDLLNWAFENLLKNALDAIESETGTATISITATTNERWVMIDISDTGKGIDKKNFEEIFTPGFSTKRRGWGLGLTLTRRIIEEYHQGKVFVLHSSPEHGTTFRVMLSRLS